MVAYRLKVSAHQEQIDFVIMLCLEASNVAINGVELAMTTPFDRDLPVVR